MGLAAESETKNPAVGRVAVTGRDADRVSFMVPTPRNVELTYPYRAGIRVAHRRSGDRVRHQCVDQQHGHP